ncbi:MAG: nucleoside triphosphate pyrophosphohydrolase [Chloroflexota bacterium]
MNAGITLLGLGPGNPAALTIEAWEVLNGCKEVYVRTRQHPTVDAFPKGVQIHSFDHLYDQVEDYKAVYHQIVERIIELGHRPGGVIYAVPGHPFVAEATGIGVARRSHAEGIRLRVVPGLSFLEPVYTALNIDPFPHMTLVDALEIAGLHVPPFPPNVHALIAQLYSRQVASEVKLTLMFHYPDEHPVYLVHAAGMVDEKVEQLPLYAIDRSAEIGLLSSLYLPPLDKETSFEAFQEVIARLRAPDGCPWDKEQTHKSLRPHLLEEAYETLAALDAEDAGALKEELGDLLLQIFLHAQIAGEEGEFAMADILAHIHKKIVLRHPHVFAGLQLEDVEGVLHNWERLKAAERAANGEGEKGLLDGVSVTLPALAQAEAFQKRAARVGFDWPDVEGVMSKVLEELEEFRAATTTDIKAEEIGDLLFAVVNLSRWYGVDAESALREANARFKQRFNHIERGAREQGRSLDQMSLQEMDALWDEAKGV